VLAHHPGMIASKKCCEINAIVSGGIRFFAVLSGAYGGRNRKKTPMLAPQPRSGALWVSNSNLLFEQKDRT
jgi:hypothetical protein